MCARALALRVRARARTRQFRRTIERAASSAAAAASASARRLRASAWRAVNFSMPRMTLAASVAARGGALAGRNVHACAPTRAHSAA
jgi:hypothetical protein